MKLVVTIKMIPESKEELANDAPSQVEQVRTHYYELAKEAILGPPDKVSVRFLFASDQLGS